MTRLAEMHKDQIIDALSKCNGVRSLAAAHLGVHRHTLINWLAKNLDVLDMFPPTIGSKPKAKHTEEADTIPGAGATTVSNSTASSQNQQSDESYTITTDDHNLNLILNTRTPRTYSARCIEQIMDECLIDRKIWYCDKIQISKSDGDQRNEVDPSSPIVIERYCVRATFKRHHPLASGLIADEIVKIITDAKIPPLPKSKQTKIKKGRCLQICPFDIHIGSLTWKPETGQSYNVKRAVEIFETLTSEILASTGAETGAFEQIALVIGGDWIHTDNQRGETTKGTRVDTDGRLSKSYKRAFESVIRVIDHLKTITPRVVVIVIPGNHDRTITSLLGLSIHARYFGDDSVEVDDSPAQFKCLEFGNTFVGYCHGDELKPELVNGVMHDLRPHTMAKLIEQGLVAEMHVGHLHTRRATKYRPIDTREHVLLRVLPSLAARSPYANAKGYRDAPAYEAFIHCEVKGASVGTWIERPNVDMYK